MMSDEIRNIFLEYFKQSGHTIVPSSSLLPGDDPTLLFTNAGMVQFKGIFQNREKVTFKRAVSSQKCMRAGGKHNDLENVGKTERHHTFFEMLGNFSFGDYFKDKSIEFAWEFLTEKVGLEAGRLWVTIFQNDSEAAEIWQKKIGLPAERIVPMGERDNFWAMGDTGPCGPCSEIIIDQGENVGCGKDDCRVGCDCDRFLELWNLVFMQYERDSDGKLTPLPRRCIDTGMGLERLTAVIQGKRSNYDSDLFAPIIETVEHLSGSVYRKKPTTDISIKVIADHARAVTFLIGDGVLPSNEGRGYVLRRIIRRAARFGQMLGMDKPFLYKVSDSVIKLMGNVYPEIRVVREAIINTTLDEEKRFLETLSTGIAILEEEMENLKGRTLPGDVAFRLYDTYGFPLDLTLDILKEHGLKVDEEGFRRAMDEQKKRAKMVLKGNAGEEMERVYDRLLSSNIRTKFIGYDKKTAYSKVLCIIKDNNIVDRASNGESVGIITAETPFYGESGGQTGDRGFIISKGLNIEVKDTKRPSDDLIVHECIVREGGVSKGDAVELIPDLETREVASSNHTATHLLHAVLRKLLGTHVKQAGSLVSPKRLRFDFYHFSPLTYATLERIEEEINARIRENMRVKTAIVSYQEAINRGALAFFGERYGETVRLVEIDNFSKELCGGTHAGRTGDIGAFILVSESSVAAGVRRIEAITGEEAVKYMQREFNSLKQSCLLLKTASKVLPDKIKKLLEQQRSLEKEVSHLKDRLKEYSTDEMLKRIEKIMGIDIISMEVDTEEIEDLRVLADRLRNKIASGVVILGCRKNGKAHLLAAVTKNILNRINANNLIKQLADLMDGRGGGRPDMAQAGSNKPEKLNIALSRSYEIIEKMIAERKEGR